MKKSFAIISCIATGLTYANVEVNLKDESANQLKRIIACIDDSDTLYRIGIACERNKNVLNNDQNVATYAITRFFRGVCNVITSPLEIIRSPFVDSQSCIVTGSSNALCRFFNGVIEFSTFGIYESKIYGNEFPEYIWGSRWKPQVGLNDLALFSRFCIEKSALKGHFKQPTHKLTFGHETLVARDGGSSMLSVKITECRSDLICPKYHFLSAHLLEFLLQATFLYNQLQQIQDFQVNQNLKQAHIRLQIRQSLRG